VCGGYFVETKKKKKSSLKKKKEAVVVVAATTEETITSTRRVSFQESGMKNFFFFRVTFPVFGVVYYEGVFCPVWC
jgi:hypothetical protein